MAKFVTKMALAAFRHFPDVWKTEIDSLFDVCDQFGAPFELPEESSAEDRRRAQDYIRSMNGFFRDLADRDEADPEWFFDSFVSIETALRKDPSDGSRETWLALSEGIQEAEWLLYVTETVYTNQGAVTEDENGEERFPKLLLVSADKFNRELQSTRRDINLSYLYRSFGNGLRYEIFMHEGLDQSDWGFTVLREPFSEPDETFSYRVNLINYSAHLISSYFVRGNRERLRVFTEQECIVNGDYCSHLDMEHENCCSAPYFSCPKRTMETVLTILSLLSQYVLIKDSLTRPAPKRDDPQEHPDPAPSFSFDGITVYDYSSDCIPDYHEGRYTGTGMHGTEKRPHIRKATIRYNPRTGKRDIIVSSCVIHRDRFKGFETADRIN